MLRDPLLRASLRLRLGTVLGKGESKERHITTEVAAPQSPAFVLDVPVRQR
jgi:hypothetical protein